VTVIRIDCRDPVVSRDGRPFGKEQGNKMRSLLWPLPSVVAGSLRTAVGKNAAVDFGNASQDLLQLAVAGVFPVVDATLYLPAPNDCFHHENRPLAVTPQQIESGGCDLPAKLLPVMLTEQQAKEDAKPSPVPTWWPIDSYAEWLTTSRVSFNERFLKAPQVEERTHVVMNAERGAGEDGGLFSTAALPLDYLPRFEPQGPAFADRYAPIHLTARAEAAGWCGEQLAKLNTLHPLGGERRLVHWRRDTAKDLWQPPSTIVNALTKDTKHVRMALATPALFAHGWKPGWLNDDLIGVAPGTNLTLRLIGLTIQRWKAISGWSYQPQAGCPHPGPKPIRRMVPAGGVYFFHVEAGDPSTLADRWLRSVSDYEHDKQDQRDGFGLACWGVWFPKENI